jgi:hypothetical protein
MINDPIIEEVRQHRQEYARRFNYDADKIVADLNRRSTQHKERLVSYPPRPARKRQMARRRR